MYFCALCSPQAKRARAVAESLAPLFRFLGCLLAIASANLNSCIALDLPRLLWNAIKREATALGGGRELGCSADGEIDDEEEGEEDRDCSPAFLRLLREIDFTAAAQIEALLSPELDSSAALYSVFPRGTRFAVCVRVDGWLGGEGDEGTAGTVDAGSTLLWHRPGPCDETESEAETEGERDGGVTMDEDDDDTDDDSDDDDDDDDSRQKDENVLTINLCPGGARRLLTRYNRKELARLLCRHHRHRLANSSAARWIAEGMVRLVPRRLLPLISARELELLCCGQRRGVDVALLRRRAKYKGGLHSDSRRVRMLWRVLESFALEEREQFLRFVWGRARLPASEAAFYTPFRITRFRAPARGGGGGGGGVGVGGGGSSGVEGNGGSNPFAPLAQVGSGAGRGGGRQSPAAQVQAQQGSRGGRHGSRGGGNNFQDAYLPRSHTCFFQLDLPSYSSDAVMRKRLLFAMYNAMTIHDE